MQENPELAQEVKRLRTAEGHSWRALAGEISKQYPNLDIATADFGEGLISGNQVDGQLLCEAAMEYFDETNEDGWN